MMLRFEDLYGLQYAWLPILMLLWYVDTQNRWNLRPAESWIDERIRNVLVLELSFGLASFVWVTIVSIRCLLELAATEELSAMTAIVLSWILLYRHLICLRRWQTIVSLPSSAPLRD